MKFCIFNRMLESRLKTLEVEMGKKNAELEYLRSEVKEKGSLEAELRKDNERLHEQVCRGAEGAPTAQKSFHDCWEV